MYLHKFLQLPLTLALPLSQAVPSGTFCKPQPGDRHWPSPSAWQRLNSSVSGRLYQPIPPGAVCHPSWPQYDKVSCANLATTKWAKTGFHALNSVSVDYNDETCLPNATAPCSLVGYPSYVLEAESEEDVQHGVNFAHETGVRMVVKGTGHDFPGRSSGPDSLLIYTHKLRGIETVKKLDSKSDTNPAALVKISAGERMQDVLKFAVANNLTPIGGADPHVGIGGWILGGGHGPLTGKYGMGADQVVEMRVVTADGTVTTVSPQCKHELFWALRGSGGSTYAVLISVTVRMYPSISVGNYLFAYNTTSDSETFWSMNAYFHMELPKLARANIFCYYFCYPLNQDTGKGMVAGSCLAPSQTAKHIADVMKPMEDHFKSNPWGDFISAGGIPVDYEDFAAYWALQTAQDAGFSGRLGSRILDEKALTGDMEQLKTALRDSTPVPWNMLGHVVAGAGTKNPPNGIPGGSNAVGPAWRSAITHVVLPRIWQPLNETAKIAVTNPLRSVNVEALRKLAPDTGAYVNEVDPTEPNWHLTLYGENYDRLLEIKRKWDPKGTFWCKHCIGSDLWEAIGDDGIENGVGQSRVRLCRK